LEAKVNQAVSFFIKLENFYDADRILSVTLENSQTREKLVFKSKTGYVTISRYPMGTNRKEWKEMCQHPNHDRQVVFEKRCIPTSVVTMRWSSSSE
jgi:hypothetical protein